MVLQASPRCGERRRASLAAGRHAANPCLPASLRVVSMMIMVMGAACSGALVGFALTAHASTPHASMLIRPAGFRTSSAAQSAAKRSCVRMDEAAAKAAWLARQDQAMGRGGGSAPATGGASGGGGGGGGGGGSNPPWGAELIAMAEMCNGGTEYACSQLSSEEQAKKDWLRNQPCASPGSKAAAALGGGHMCGDAWRRAPACVRAARTLRSAKG